MSTIRSAKMLRSSEGTTPAATWPAEAVAHIHALGVRSRQAHSDFDAVSSENESAACDWVDIILSSGLPQPYIYNTRRGTIQFEWERGAKSVELEIEGPTASKWFFRDDAQRLEAEGAVTVENGLPEFMERVRETIAAG